jgi:3-deoxy-D-manno-octulosonic-acid transferase
LIFLYNLFIQLFLAAISVSSLWNKKSKRWINGRKDLFRKLETSIQKQDRVIWVHVSSTGELEQAKPVIEKLKEIYPQHKILLTIFSPSAWSSATQFKSVDIVSYLPADTGKYAKQFISIVHPDLILFIKYEFWYHHLATAAFHHIPILLVSGVFRKDQLFFKPYGKFYRQILFLFTHLFVQDELSADVLKTHHIDHFSISGDTRYDRVKQIAEHFTEVPLITKFIQQSTCIVCGSTWKEDEQAILNAIDFKNNKLIIAPHEINETRIKFIEDLFSGTSVRYSELPGNENKHVLIIDNVGMLSRLYNYGTICYVGGGFTKDGVHNVLEAAVYGKPVLFGPNYSKYREANELIQNGGGFSFQSEEELQQVIKKINNDQATYNKAAKKAKESVMINAGATEKVIAYIQEKRLLTN